MNLISKFGSLATRLLYMYRETRDLIIEFCLTSSSNKHAFQLCNDAKCHFSRLPYKWSVTNDRQPKYNIARCSEGNLANSKSCPSYTFNLPQGAVHISFLSAVSTIDVPWLARPLPIPMMIIPENAYQKLGCNMVDISLIWCLTSWSSLMAHIWTTRTGRSTNSTNLSCD